ncbi:metallophosphoesterase family protein [Catellatospora vulcania]|uniref:metallophosphoesterase family protein n=1 Tax=Catellatospora vulcania TaxID=1460450 RepID=UPI0012D440C7|nr:metallophosphoesterase [Catellatospora vulcania]
MTSASGNVWAVSDLHLAYAENRAVADRLLPRTPADWLIVAGDVAEHFAEVRTGLERLRSRFAQVIWAPGNHELWTPPGDPVGLRGQERYDALVDMCRSLDVYTPEDPYLRHDGPDGPVVIAPLFVLYDYTFRPPGCATKAEGLAVAHRTGIVCTDEYLLHPDPYPSREAWCAARLTHTEALLSAVDPAARTVLVNHFPLVREPTRILRHPEFAQWCGTTATADWHLRHRAHTVVYGHLHIPRTTHHDGVRFEEVSVGYPREWQARPTPPGLRLILPAEPTPREPT